MKKISLWFFLVVCVGLALVGCQAVATPTPSPLEWLRNQPFEPAPSEGPNFITSGLPEGFEVVGDDAYTYTEELVDDEYFQITEISYTQTSGGQENSVLVNITAFSSAEARSYFLDDMQEYVDEGDEWGFEQFSGGQVVRIQINEFDSRIWVHGPYLILVGSESDGTVPWVNVFAELYLTQPPSPGRDITEQPSVEQPVEVSPPGLPGEQPVEVDLLAWLREQPFEPASSEWPEVITSGFPEGFEVDGPDSWTDELPSGETVQISWVEYDQGQITVGNEVEVYVVGFQNAEARSEFITTWLGEAEFFEWSLEQLHGTQFLRFHVEGSEGRILISGPYLVWIAGSGEEGNTWVDTFTELYLTLPTSPESPYPLNWLREQPFIPVPPEWPEVITSGLPENWLILDPDFETEKLPSGETVKVTRVTYQWPLGCCVRSENNVVVYILGFQNPEARLELLDRLMEGEENYEFSLVQFGDAQVVRYHERGSTDGRTWVSGPYLILIRSSAFTRNPWVDMFTEYYLALYPAN